MQFLKKLKTTLRFSEISGLYLYSAFAAVLLYASFTSPYIYIFLFLYLGYLFKKNKILFFHTLFILLLLSLAYVAFFYFYNSIEINNEIEGIVVMKGDGYFLLREKTYLIKVYSKETGMCLGDKICVKGKIITISERNVRNTFSYYRYKLSKRIVADYKMISYETIGHPFNIVRIRGYIEEYITNNYSNLSSMYIKRLFLGISSFSDEMDEEIKNTGIIYLFCISGLHISILKEGIRKIMRLINVPEEIISISLILILFLYLFIAIYSVSIFRSVVMNTIIEIASIFGKRTFKTDVLSFSMFINLLVNPFQFFSMGFFFTYLSTLIIYLTKEKNQFLLSAIIISFNIPLLFYYNNEVSLFLLFYAFLFSIFFTKVFIPLTYIVILFPPLGFFYHYLALILNYTISFSEGVNIMIPFSIISPFFLFLIYFALLLAYKSGKKMIKKSLIIILSLLSLNYLSGRYALIPEVVFLDVNQGDSILLRSGFKNILIDTGSEDEYDTTIKYLESLNIRSLSAMYISHGDSDHDGEAEDLITKLNVKNIYRDLDGFSIEYNEIKIKTYSLQKEGATDNDNSMVLLVKIYNETYLFTGDIEEEGENYLLGKDIENITYLKVSHHGSDSSSSEGFLEKMKPLISVISVGENNTYGHPAKKIVKRLEKISKAVYRTDKEGSITIYNLYRINVISSYLSRTILPFQNIKNGEVIIR